ncbi:MAG: hypothetical protein ACRBBP_07460 [Bdellovibrionales bacterium]
MVFNFGLDSFKSSRGIASNAKNSNPELEKVVIKDLSKMLEGRETKHGVDPTLEEQFLFGFLKGNYKTFKVGKNMMSLKLKGGQKALAFTENGQKKDLVQEFKKVYLAKNINLADPVENRYVASEQVSYSLLEKNIIVGRLDLKFSQEQELLEININRL